MDIRPGSMGKPLPGIDAAIENFYAHIPGIRVVAPATFEDARGMLWTALEARTP